MEQLLPPFFIAIAALALCGAIYAVWQSVRGLFASDAVQASDRPRSARAGLVDEKVALLQTLKDIGLERDLGKISDQDFEALNARYRKRAKQVLRKLDEQLGPYRGEAAAMLTESAAENVTENVTTDGASESGAASEPTETTAATDAPAESRRCPACHYDNAADAVFCNQCGARVTEARP